MTMDNEMRRVNNPFLYFNGVVDASLHTSSSRRDASNIPNKLNNIMFDTSHE